jgi:hypothetical protein
MLPFATGVISPDPDHIRRADALHRIIPRTVVSTARSLPANVLPITALNNQRSDPSCVGQAGAANAWALAPWLRFRPSGKDLWLDSQRFWMANADVDPTTGSFPYCAFLALIKHGLSPYRDHEDGAPLSVAGWSGGAHKKDSWSDVSKAYDNRVRGTARRYRIASDGRERSLEVKAAIDARFGILVCAGLRPPFGSYRSDESTGELVLGTDAIGGNANLHAMRLAGYRWVGDELQGLLVNSWGPDWGGARGPKGEWYHGCCWVAEEVLYGLHDIWCCDFSEEE